MATKHPDSAPRLGGVLISNQVVAELLEQLRNGIWQDTDHLPPELELANRLNVSRTVVRDALSELERAGYIERVRGTAGGAAGGNHLYIRRSGSQ